jgi:hypothetical protein
MDLATDCVPCGGTGMIPGALDTRPGFPAHPYGLVCGCGIMVNDPLFTDMNYQAWGILPFITHPQALARANGWVAWVDELLKDDIEQLWSAGVQTYSSCQDNSPGKGRWVNLSEEDAAFAEKILPWVTVTEKAFRGVLLLENERKARQ